MKETSGKSLDYDDDDDHNAVSAPEIKVSHINVENA